MTQWFARLAGIWGAAPPPKRLLRVVPNENWQLLLEFEKGDFRLFKLEIARTGKHLAELAYPQKAKALTYTPEGVRWAFGGGLDARYLYQHSVPISAEQLERQTLRLGFKNQAPTAEDSKHHVFYVYLWPFNKQPFGVGESIHGGHAERGGGTSCDLPGLLAWPRWREHFVLSDCMWAVPLVERWSQDQTRLVDALVKEICRRSGEDGILT